MTRPELRVLIVAGVLCASGLTVYTQYVFLHTVDQVTNRSFREQSLEQYEQTLDGTRAFPYRWRQAGPRIVKFGENLTGLDPHLIDAVVKTAALAFSALFLMRYAALWLSPIGTLAVAALYFMMTAAAYSSEGYSIYYTNDFLMVAGWNVAITLIALDLWNIAALVVFFTAWAKETVVLIPLLALFAWRRGKATRAQLILVGAAFIVPTAILRAIYPAPLTEWAWWHNIMLNVPFLVPERDRIITAIRDNLKLLVFFNVWGWLAIRAIRRTREPLWRELGVMGLIYLALMYVVVYLRELRHFLPLLIIMLPPAVSEIERLSKERTADPSPTM